jgi:hypothetical protein
MQDDTAAHRRVGDARTIARDLGARLAPRRDLVQVQYLTVLAVGVGTVTLDAGDGTEIPNVQHLAAYQPVVGDMVRVEITGTLWVVTDAVYSPDRTPVHPWRTYVVTVPVTLTTASTQTIAAFVPFPAGLFTAPPRVSYAIQGAGVSTLMHWRSSAAVTTSGVTPVVNVATAINASLSVTVTAVQMTPTSADS